MKTTKKPARTKGPHLQSAATCGTCHYGLANVLFWDASPDEKGPKRVIRDKSLMIQKLDGKRK